MEGAPARERSCQERDTLPPRRYPLWRDRNASQPNIKSALLAHLAKVYGQSVKAEDVMAYLAAVMAQPAFTKVSNPISFAPAYASL